LRKTHFIGLDKVKAQTVFIFALQFNSHGVVRRLALEVAWDDVHSKSIFGRKTLPIEAAKMAKIRLSSARRLTA